MGLQSCLRRPFNCQRDLPRTWIQPHRALAPTPDSAYVEVLEASSARQGPPRSDLCQRAQPCHSQSATSSFTLRVIELPVAPSPHPPTPAHTLSLCLPPLLGQEGRVLPAPRASDGAVPWAGLPPILKDILNFNAVVTSFRKSSFVLLLPLISPRYCSCLSVRLASLGWSGGTEATSVEGLSKRLTGPHREASTTSLCHYPHSASEETESWRSEGTYRGRTAAPRWNWGRSLQVPRQALSCAGRALRWRGGELGHCEIGGWPSQTFPAPGFSDPTNITSRSDVASESLLCPHCLKQSRVPLHPFALLKFVFIALIML